VKCDCAYQWPGQFIGFKANVSFSTSKENMLSCKEKTHSLLPDNSHRGTFTGMKLRCQIYGTRIQQWMLAKHTLATKTVKFLHINNQQLKYYPAETTPFCETIQNTA
jgi:hypothetical protein